MKRSGTLWLAVPPLLAIVGGCTPEKPQTADGKALFMQNCSGCHPDGGNALTPVKTLRKIDRQANGIVTSRDIVAKMRHPGPGMPRFDRARLTDQEAEAIADFVLKSF